jgi:glycine/D-amino acid oxidase-like deaminating enzyme
MILVQAEQRFLLPGGCVLPRAQPRDSQRRRAREALHRIGGRRPQHHDPPLELQDPEGARFYDASVKLYEGLSTELNFNLLFSQCGHLTLAHSDPAMFVMANRSATTRSCGNSRAAPTAAASRSTRTPITTHILQACVTEPVKPLLDVVILSSQMHVYISQTDRGEFLMGAEIEPWTTYLMQGTLNFLQEVCRHTIELFPQLERARLLRSWAGLCDLVRFRACGRGRQPLEGNRRGWTQAPRRRRR